MSGGRGVLRGVLTTLVVTLCAVLGLSVGLDPHRSIQLEPEVLGATVEQPGEDLVRAPPMPADFVESFEAEALHVAPPTAPPQTPVTSTPAAPATSTPAAPVTTTPAAPTVPPDSRSLEERVLAAVDFDWRSALPGWRIEFTGPRAGYRGSTFPSSRLIQVYVRPTSEFDDLVHVLAHELGHAVDVSHLDDAQRDAFAVSRGRDPDDPWWVASGESDFASGAGDWAECFAWYVTNRRGGFYSRVGPPPDAADSAVIAGLLPP